MPSYTFPGREKRSRYILANVPCGDPARVEVLKQAERTRLRVDGPQGQQCPGCNPIVPIELGDLFKLPGHSAILSLGPAGRRGAGWPQPSPSRSLSGARRRGPSGSAGTYRCTACRRTPIAGGTTSATGPANSAGTLASHRLSSQARSTLTPSAGRGCCEAGGIEFHGRTPPPPSPAAEATGGSGLTCLLRSRRQRHGGHEASFVTGYS
jgi:hypothetical protein